jgi:alkyl hydroperoxide reductase subunit AhpC
MIVEAGLLEVVDLAERYVPYVLAAALKEALRIRQTRSVRDSQRHACPADRHVTDDTLTAARSAKKAAACWGSLAIGGTS